MLSWSQDIVPLRTLALRALLGYPMLRALLFVIAALVNAFAGPGSASGLDNPMGVIAIASTLGAIDLRRRGEWLLWQNLGYSRAAAPAMFGIVALLGELLIAWVRP
jgi:hypothetical protein